MLGMRGTCSNLRIENVFEYEMVANETPERSSGDGHCVESYDH